MKFRSSYISIAAKVRWRKEHFGGILFHTGTGTMIDVDREAYRFIELVQRLGIVDINDLDGLWFQVYDQHINRSEVIRMVKKLLALGILPLGPAGKLKKDYIDSLPTEELSCLNWPSSPVLSSPETVHWAITFQCDETCPDCYVRRHQDAFKTELDSRQSLAMIDKIADAGVFQLAIGGGEPFMRDDLVNIVAKAKDRNLVVHVTTGRYRHEPNVLKEIGKYIQSMQIGIKQEALLLNPEIEKKKLTELMKSLGEQGIDVGANLILSHSVLGEFEQLVEQLASVGFKRITLLRYKPPHDRNRWIKEKPDVDALLTLEPKLAKTVADYPHIQFRVDCGLAFLERNLPSSQAASYGIRGCTAADRILSLAPDGSIFPCSQLVGEKFYAGNFYEDNFESVWRKSKVLRTYRNFRNNKAFKPSLCGQCTAKTQCGGCRVFAEDALGGDPGCPAPLRTTTGHKEYSSADRFNTLVEIQESIGFTDGGFPYATLEEIEGWLEEEDDRDYPYWLRRKNVKGSDLS